MVEASHDRRDPASAGSSAELAMQEEQRSRFSRRSFLGMSSALAAAVAVPACTDRVRSGVGVAEGSQAVPQTGLAVPETGAATRFLNPDQYRTVEAIAARIVPGDDDDPGAVQAGAVDFVDRLLATHESYPQRTFVAGPYARGYEGDEEPPPEDGVVWVPEDELDRYGWQVGHPPRELYRMGLARLDALAEQRHGAPFRDLDDDQQDELLAAMEDGEDDDVVELFEPLRSGDVFTLLRDHVLQGFLSDPMYGGNRDMVGWRLVGFPGAQRAYSPPEMLDPDFSRPPQSLAMLPMLHGAHGDQDALGAVRRRHPRGPLD